MTFIEQAYFSLDILKWKHINLNLLQNWDPAFSSYELQLSREFRHVLYSSS